MNENFPIMLSGIVVLAIVVLAIRGSTVGPDAERQRPLVTAIALLAGLLTGGSVATVSANNAADQVDDRLESQLDQVESDLKAKIDRVTEDGALPTDESSPATEEPTPPAD